MGRLRVYESVKTVVTQLAVPGDRSGQVSGPVRGPWTVVRGMISGDGCIVGQCSWPPIGINTILG